ncbi:hypothetical protein GCM10023310_14460 [Paenibacillus vulneris]|uniref:Glutathione S-transferase C-terminal domain-containing protein n=1 Tax=Paenibacillus vulneris TaxID=1133364 RepID=A0ABW3UIX7_9BACL|nr:MULTISPECIES: hypothetical protein [unclassified Paenibacillus]MBE1441662.1 hypothetical protein [Paenibacillus sp. OAS669]
MAETYRKSKIEHYLDRLLVRKQALIRQLELHELEQSKEFIRGQLAATDMIIWELAVEFDLTDQLIEGGRGNVSERCAKKSIGAHTSASLQGHSAPTN